jgi:CubicO group peptidase (beta-lactamase class C family)
VTVFARPATWPELRLMEGTPPPPERLVTADNWIEGPYNRWGFLHVSELACTARIRRGAGPVSDLPAVPVDLDDVPIAFEGHSVRFADALEHTFTDGICVVHDGRIVLERYVEGMEPDSRHLLMSVSKSLTATMIGALVGDGVLAPDDLVTDHVAALRGTAWEGCTLQHLLDMRAGTRFDEEDYDDPDSDGVLIDEVSGYRARRHPELPPDIPTWARSLPNDGPHGGPFKYRSILTDVLAWAAVEATGTRFPELFSRAIWSRIGAEQDAEVIVDPSGFAAAEGGICTTLRDLARIGVMQLGDGAIAGRQVVPADWVQRVRRRDDELIAAFDDELLAEQPNACYHDCWWVWDPDAGIYSGYGINGQQLLVHGPSRTVIARFSTWPTRSDLRLAAHADAQNVAILSALG